MYIIQDIVHNLDDKVHLRNGAEDLCGTATSYSCTRLAPREAVEVRQWVIRTKEREAERSGAGRDENENDDARDAALHSQDR